MQQLWLPGHKLKNRLYEILEALGQGGFGVTYKAKNLALDVPVVIKTPNIGLQRDKNYSKYLESFQKEARQLAKLGMNPHPHIVRVFDFFAEDDLPCIIMDYIPGDSLYDLVQMNGALSEVKSLEYIRQIGSALSVCHNRGIFHRDVHPNNILIHAESGKAILIDFGISGSTQSTRSNRSGNKAFAPWEQLISFGEQSSKTPQVDIYTLAASFYYLVTGETSTPSLARKFNNDELIEPKQHNREISDRINEAILKGMEIEPGDRPQSVAEWLELMKPDEILLTESKANPINNESKQQKNEYGIAFQFSEDLLDRDKKARENYSKQILKKRIEKQNVSEVVLYNFWKFETVKIKKIRASSGLFGFGKKQTVVDYSREQKHAKYFTEDLGNGITIEMVEIPGGTFMMGSPEDEEGRYKDESPQQQVTVSSFYMGKYEVTQAQWKQVASMPQIERELKPEPSHFKGDDLPVEQVSWYDAVEFCKRLSKATGKEYRLPSEAQWEYGCRAGTTTPFHYGETITSKLVNYLGLLISTYADEPKGEFREKHTPVGSFPPNAFGLYDMHGNVWEWCADTYQESYEGAPRDGSAWIAEGSSSTHILRGGSWVNNRRFCRSACRNMIAPDLSYNSFGFRCIATRTL